MLRAGLVSVTLRSLAPVEIIALVARTGLRSIEWGGDVHVPAGDDDRARRVRDETLAAGLSVSSYGSYYRVGESEQSGQPFERVLGTALSLGAPIIRVWAGSRGSSAAGDHDRRRVAADSRRIAALAAEAGVSVAYEFHEGTLTDTPESTLLLLESTSHCGVSTFWQSRAQGDPADQASGLQAVLPYVTNVHVGHGPAHDRRPLREGRQAWRRYLDILLTVSKERTLSLEFVRGGSVESFRRDADELLEWLECTVPTRKEGQDG